MKTLCLGMLKTGTSSLSLALGRLGFQSVHSSSICQEITATVKAGDVQGLSTLLSMADAFSDWPHAVECFPRIAEMVPDSRFILTTRPMESWINSCLMHVLYDRLLDTNSWRDIDTRQLIAEYEHLYQLCDEFRGQEPHRMLILDVRDKDAWTHLRSFVGVEDACNDGACFPHENHSLFKAQAILNYYQVRHHEA